MKLINTLSIITSLCLTVLITLVLTSASVQATERPITQIEQAEKINSDTLKQTAVKTLAQNMRILPLALTVQNQENLSVTKIANTSKNLVSKADINRITE
jgi:hypothetical protein